MLSNKGHHRDHEWKKEYFTGYLWATCRNFGQSCRLRQIIVSSGFHASYS